MSKKTKTEKPGTGKQKGGKKVGLALPEKGTKKSVEVEQVPVEGKRTGAEKKRGTADSKQVFVEERRGMEERQVMLISKALADPTRLSIFRSIARGGASCGSIRDRIAVSAATLSHHMKELETAGLIETSREGRFMHAALHKKVWKSYVNELKSFAK